MGADFESHYSLQLPNIWVLGGSGSFPSSLDPHREGSEPKNPPIPSLQRSQSTLYLHQPLKLIDSGPLPGKLLLQALEIFLLPRIDAVCPAAARLPQNHGVIDSRQLSPLQLPLRQLVHHETDDGALLHLPHIVDTWKMYFWFILGFFFLFVLHPITYPWHAQDPPLIFPPPPQQLCMEGKGKSWETPAFHFRSKGKPSARRCVFKQLSGILLNIDIFPFCIAVNN